MKEEFCQSCAMPLVSDTDYGTNKDGSANDEYCSYCYQKGEFTEELEMDEMIEHCLQFIDEFNKDSDEKVTVDEARTQMKQYFPKLKRWA